MILCVYVMNTYHKINNYNSYYRQFVCQNGSVIGLLMYWSEYFKTLS